MHKFLNKKNILPIFKKVINHELVSGSFYIFFASMAGNILAFLLNLFLVRKLSSNGEYAIFASLLSVITLLSIPAQSINTVIVQFATSFFSTNQKGKAAKLYSTVFISMTILSIFLFLVFLIFSHPISQFLKISDANLIVLVGVIVGLTYVSIVNTAFLQSLFRFGLVAFFLFLGTFLKLFFGVLFVYIGLKVGGVLLSLILMIFIPFLFSFIPIRFLIKQKKSDIKIPIKEILTYALPTALAVLCLSSFTSTDIILVKHFFSAKMADQYSAVALIGKIIFYFTMPIPMVMFPLLIKRFNQGLAYRSLFFLSLLLVALPSLILTTIYFSIPRVVISLILGVAKYQQVYQYVGLFGLYLTLFSLLNVLVMFFLSLKQTKVAYFVAVGAILQILSISFFHQNFIQVIGASLVIIVLLLTSLLLYYFGKYGKKTS